MDRVVADAANDLASGSREPDYDCDLGWELACGHYEVNLCPCPNAVHIKGYGDQSGD